VIPFGKLLSARLIARTIAILMSRLIAMLFQGLLKGLLQGYLDAFFCLLRIHIVYILLVLLPLSARFIPILICICSLKKCLQ